MVSYMYIRNYVFCLSAPPSAAILWLDLASSFVNLTWELTSGQAEVLELRYNSFTQDPGLSDSASIQTTNISLWERLIKNIAPTESNVWAVNDFNLGMYHAFVIDPFEDTVQQITNQITTDDPGIFTQPGIVG